MATDVTSRLERDSLAEFSRLVEFTKGLVIKDSQEAEKHENKDTIAAASVYIDFRFKLMGGAEGITDAELLETGLSREGYLNRVKEATDRYESSTIIKNRNEAEGRHDPMVDDRMLVRGAVIEEFYEHNEYYRRLHAENGVDVFKARYADDFEILKYPGSYLTDSEVVSFQRAYAKNLVYFKRVLFTHGFDRIITDAKTGERRTGNYRAFARMFVVFMTIQSMLNQKMDDIFDVDAMDDWAVRNLLYSFKIYFLDDLHIAYQRKVLKNLNTLLRYKGTDRIFATILGIFGFENIEVLSHVLSRDWSLHKQDDDIVHSVDDEGLFFRVVPYDVDDVEGYLTANPNHRVTDYVSGTQADPTWEATRAEVLEREFSLIRTKYFSINSTLDVVQISSNFAYLWNLLEWARRGTSQRDLSFLASEISTLPIDLLDALVAVNMISLRLLGLGDEVPPRIISKSVYSFTMGQEAPELSHKFEELTMAIGEPAMGLASSFAWSGLNYLGGTTFNSEEARRHFDANIKTKDAIEETLARTTDWDTYKALSADYNALFRASYSCAFFKEHATYTSYLTEQCPQILQFIDAGVEKDLLNGTGTVYLRRAMETIMHSCETYLSSENFKLHLLTSEYVTAYVRKLIDYFRSYTVQLKDLEFFYTVGENCRIIDDPVPLSLIPGIGDLLDLEEDVSYTTSLPVDEVILSERYAEILAQVTFSNATHGPRSPRVIQYEHRPGETTVVRRKVYTNPKNSIVLEVGIDDPFDGRDGDPPRPRLWTRNSSSVRTLGMRLAAQVPPESIPFDRWNITSVHRVQGDFLLRVQYDLRTSYVPTTGAGFTVTDGNATLTIMATTSDDADTLRQPCYQALLTVTSTSTIRSMEIPRSFQFGALLVGREGNSYYAEFEEGNGFRTVLLPPEVVLTPGGPFSYAIGVVAGLAPDFGDDTIGDPADPSTGTDINDSDIDLNQDDDFTVSGFEWGTTIGYFKNFTKIKGDILWTS